VEHLNALSPLDGRYREKTANLRPFFSEGAFFTYRARVEIEYLIAFLRQTDIQKLNKQMEGELRSLAELSEADLVRVKAIEAETRHDVKALEYFLREQIADTALHPYIHFGLTSEDTNNIAYALMISDALSAVILPALNKLSDNLGEIADRYQAAPMLARTHGQPASPTTFGKEMRVFQARLVRKLDLLTAHRLGAKLNGATGNYSALAAAFPAFDWVAFSEQFIRSFNQNRQTQLVPTARTTQIEPRDALAELFDLIKGVNTILLDLCGDMWRYISDGWLAQKVVDGEVGSSTMPHKVNPIHIENAEGNLGLANALLEFFSRKLPISRLQRDLSGSTVLRSIGAAFGHCLLAYNSASEGLARVALDESACLAALDAHPEVATEAIQVILKREGLSDAYERLLDLSRGKLLTSEMLEEFIAGLDLDENVKQELLAITPRSYIGLADRLS